MHSINIKTKQERLQIFIERLKSSKAENTRDKALDLLKVTMQRVEDEFSGAGKNDYGLRMNVFGWDQGWCNLDKDPCYWDDANTKTHRTEIYNNGRIVITRVDKEPHQIILDNFDV